MFQLRLFIAKTIDVGPIGAYWMHSRAVVAFMIVAHESSTQFTGRFDQTEIDQIRTG